MHLNIAQKIFSIAAVVLALMIAVAVLSIRLTANISDELDAVAGKYLPVSNAISDINVRILEQGVVLQRLFELSEEELPLRGGPRFKILGEEIAIKFSETLKIMDIKPTVVGAPNRFISMERRLKAIDTAYQNFVAHGLQLLIAHEQGNPGVFAKLLPDLNTKQDALDNAISDLRSHVDKLNDSAVLSADQNEKYLLKINIILTTLATILGLGFATLVTRALVRNVRNLVAGTEAIEAGHLDTEVAVISNDEVGKLTGSFNAMVEGLRLKERIQNTFGKYMDPRIVSNLLDNPEFAEPGGEKREMTVLFIDLKGFTSISEKLAPNDLVKMINDFFTLMTEAIAANKGVVDKYMGDAVMAYWGPPFTGPDEHAALACKAALEALERLETFREVVKAELGTAADGLDIDLRIGVSTGEMIVGTIGSKASMNFTVMGDPVNLGSRLEGASKAYGTRVLVSERTHELAGDKFVSREIDLIRVKGKIEPTRVYELMAEQGATLALPGPAMDDFNAGVAAYRRQQWEPAEVAFKECLEISPGDPPSGVYLQRIAHLKETPPPADWDGVWVFETK
ncbi:MAG: HAMP domain-containing protein [Rhodospirillales bacterium]|nr:HAMP domain-containing protein [Rhodospirillales bacterium]